MSLQDVFISYATEDNDFAAAIASGLRSNGFSVWFAPLSLKVGDKLLDSIERGLQQSRNGILILSQRYLAKNWTSYEMDILVRQHIEKNKKILPIWLDVSRQQVESRHAGLCGIVAITETRSTSSVVCKLVEALVFDASRKFERSPDSDLISQSVLESLGGRLVRHHEYSRRPFVRDEFQSAFESALSRSGVHVQLGNQGRSAHDISIAGVPISLKIEASASIREDKICVSKWMEFGRHTWDLPLLRDAFLAHLQGYSRICMLRCLSTDPSRVRYELVEIPKELLLEARNCELRICENSSLNPTPGYGYVRDAEGSIRFALYFHGGSELKLQIKGLRRDLCKVHGTWEFESSMSGVSTST